MHLRNLPHQSPASVITYPLIDKSAYPGSEWLMIACTQCERPPDGPSEPPGGQDPQVAPVLTNVTARGAGRVAPKVANIWRPNSRTKPGGWRITAALVCGDATTYRRGSDAYESLLEWIIGGVLLDRWDDQLWQRIQQHRR